MGHLTHKMTVRHSHIDMAHKRQEVAKLPTFAMTGPAAESPEISPAEETVKVGSIR